MSGIRFASLLLALVPSLVPAAETAPTPLSLDERVACQRRLAEVRWEHMLWPEQNTRPKPSFAEVMDEAVVRARALRGIKMSRALADSYDAAPSARELAGELERLGRDSRDPQLLAAYFAALDNDPTTVAECLARPLLAERRLRDLYADDPVRHAAARAIAQEARDGNTPLEEFAKRGRFAVREFRRGTIRDEAAGVIAIGDAEWADFVATLPLTRAVKESGTPARRVRELDGQIVVSELRAREENRVVLAVLSVPTESFDAWWSRTAPGVPASLPAPTEATPSDQVGDEEQASEYELPPLARAGCTPGQWTPTYVGEPQPRYAHTSIWTGAEMIVWGGLVEGEPSYAGSRYDPATDTWVDMPQRLVPDSRSHHTAVWTGTEMIVWGGYGHGLSAEEDGGAYNPTTNLWRNIYEDESAKTLRAEHTAVWTGDEMVIWGGYVYGSGLLDSGAAYDPEEGTWRVLSDSGLDARRGHTATWTGYSMCVWGGDIDGEIVNTGACWGPSTDYWQDMPYNGALDPRAYHSAVFDGTEIVFFGGLDEEELPASGGARYNDYTRVWTPLPSSGAPSPRSRHSAIWTGEEMIVWGGQASSGVLATGSRWERASNSWKAMVQLGADPLARKEHTAVWTGSEMIVFGGRDASDVVLTAGRRYDPAAQSWSPTVERAGAPEQRFNARTVWTGAEMIVWGGQQWWSHFVVPCRYDPATDSWSYGATPELEGRSFHATVWTGREMVVWGGRHRDHGAFADGGLYDPLLDRWTPITSEGAPGRRASMGFTWSGEELIFWGGLGDGASGFQTLLAHGARYNPFTDTWATMNEEGAPVARYNPIFLWAGDRVFLFAGMDDDFGVRYSGAVYFPRTDTWSQISAPGDKLTRRKYAAGIWNGSRVLIWGGRAEEGYDWYQDGAYYNPSYNSWAAVDISDPDVPAPRGRHTMVWTGEEAIVWGGHGDFDDLGDGGALDEDSRYWRALPVTSTSAPPRREHTALWTGTRLGQMLVYGGNPNVRSGGLYCARTCHDPAPGAIFITNVTKSNSAGWSRIYWDGLGGTTSYDVVAGDASKLSTSGSLALSSEECLANSTSNTEVMDGLRIAPGEARWYLVRARNDCGASGTWDAGSPSQVGSRDDAMDAAGARCP